MRGQHGLRAWGYRSFFRFIPGCPGDIANQRLSAVADVDVLHGHGLIPAGPNLLERRQTLLE